MDGQQDTHAKVDLLTAVPGRNDSRLVLNVNPERFDDVMSKIGAAWGLADLEGCVLSYPSSSYGTTLVVSSQEEWMYSVSQNFFRQRDDHGKPLLVNLHTQAAPPCKAELSVATPTRASSAVGSAEEQAVCRQIQSAQEAQAAKISQLMDTNTSLCADVTRLKATISAQTQDCAAKSASLDALQARHDALDAKYAAQSKELVAFKTSQAQEVAKLTAEIARISSSNHDQAQELANLKSANSVGNKSGSGKKRQADDPPEDGKRFVWVNSPKSAKVKPDQKHRSKP